MENIDQVHNEFLTFEFGGATGDDVQAEIDCPFVPDIIRITGFCDASFTTGGAVAVSCSAFQNKVIAVVDEGNQFSHTMTFTNKNRTTFQGIYRFDTARLNNDPETITGHIALAIEFVRFKEVPMKF